jgi:hypothetical protein
LKSPSCALDGNRSHSILGFRATYKKEGLSARPHPFRRDEIAFQKEVLVLTHAGMID